PQQPHARDRRSRSRCPRPGARAAPGGSPRPSRASRIQDTRERGASSEPTQEEEVQGDGPVADRIRRIWQSMKDEYTKEKEESDE
ncbi:MAG: hypothetical protein IH840_09165, partial [Candidatus Heimdallarchaeota archaeon]|nr:hypothetical protein [Candidatus Heimdallarchaeota archaeon]